MFVSNYRCIGIQHWSGIPEESVGDSRNTMGADVLSTELLYRAENKDEEPLFSQPEENAAIY